jgi:beta-glucanase (GH16 family)
MLTEPRRGSLRPGGRRRGRRLSILSACLVILGAAGCGTTRYAASPAPHETPPPAQVAALGGLTWSDEFDGPEGAEPDPSRWGHDLGGDWNKQELQYYTASTENASINGRGQLVVTARKDTTAGRTCPNGPCQYSSGRLSTAGRFSQLYGTFETRIKLPAGPGVLPAFWMLGDNIHEVGWPNCGEIDVVEHPGERADTIHGSVHGRGYSAGETYRLPRSRAFSDDFHTFTVKWMPKAVEFFVDGIRYARQTSTTTGTGGWVYDHPFFLVLNLAVGGEWAGAPNGRVEFPQQMLVDYVRVYAWDGRAS